MTDKNTLGVSRVSSWLWRPALHVGVIVGLAAIHAVMAQEPVAGTAWAAPDRAAKVAALIPGRKVPNLTRETLFADWTKQQVEKWAKEHPSTLSPAEQYKQFAESAPTDAELLADFPRHIAPLARVRSGKPAITGAAEGAFYSYCPLCQSQSFALRYDPKNEYHATTVCCNAELFGRDKDFPADYKLKPTETVKFQHLDDTLAEVPCTLFTDKDGVVWELFVKTIFDQKRWLNVGGDLIKKYGDQFKKSGDPLYAHKIAVLLDAVADTYYGLPLVYKNEVAKAKDGKALTRAAWEASPRPNVFSVGPLGPWNRRLPNFNRGWLNMGSEHIWAEPFALARHHPAFKLVSTQKHGDPEALDRKVTEKLMRELCLTFKSVFSQKLLTNYQDAIYMNMILLGVLAQDQTLTGLFVPAHEVTLYNHTYHDGMNGEGAPNYMGMPCSYFLPYLSAPDGWLRFHPDFVQDHPFYATASAEWRKLNTVRGMSIEFGDQHIATWPIYGLPGPEVKAKNEKLGSRNWADYGVGILRVGGANHRLELSMDYTRATLHNSQDALSIECWVDGVPVMRRGGYACWWWSAPLQWDRPEIKALAAMDFPRKIGRADGRNPSWSWDYTHSPLCHNSPMVDGVGTGVGWGRDDRGYGEVITFKGGEGAGEPGSDFQILDVSDRYAWPQVGKRNVTDFRRTLIAIATPDGRPYAVDLLKLCGGSEHTLFNSAWAERAAAVLPVVASRADNLEDILPGGGAHRGTDVAYFRQIRQIERHQPATGHWEVTWKTDFAAYAPRKADGTFVRPLPDPDGKVRLRLIGLERDPESATLISAKGPWIARHMQPLPEGKKTDGYVAFEDARDLLIERRGSVADGKDPFRDSLFIHVLEGFREGEVSVIRSAELLRVESVSGSDRDLVAIQLVMVNGKSDTVLYQSASGVVRLPDGTETDARYALIRRGADGTVQQIESCRGSFVRGGGMDHKFPGDPTGEIVDLIGDLTGTRQESALMVKTTTPWPDGEALKGRELQVIFASDLREPGAEGYRIEKVTNLGAGRVRIDLQDHAPFIESWHDVFDFAADKPGSVRTTRPLSKHSNNPWYDGMTAWFPEKGRTYTIKSTKPVSGGVGGDTVEFAGAPDFVKDGIAPGDWFVIYGIRPGLKVNVAGEWRLAAVPGTAGE